MRKRGGPLMNANVSGCGSSRKGHLVGGLCRSSGGNFGGSDVGDYRFEIADFKVAGGRVGAVELA
jgi:hypothetical protein